MEPGGLLLCWQELCAGPCFVVTVV